MRENKEKLRITKMFTKCFDVCGKFYEIGSRVKDNGFSQQMNKINPSNKA